MRRLRRALAVLGASALGLGTVVSIASAYVASTNGDATYLTSPPADVTTNGIKDMANMFVFDERQNVTLAAPLQADYNLPGTYTKPGSPITIPVGTVIDSHYIDNMHAPNGTVDRQATITFAQDIVGVIVSRGKLDASDVLGNAATNYGGAYPGREMETDGSDWVQLVNSRTLVVHTHTTTVPDQVRVLTKPNLAPVPNPGGPYSTTEGTTLTLAGSATDPDGDPITAEQWTFSASGPNGVSCTYTGTTTFSPTVKCNDDALVTATLKAKDAYHAFVTATPASIAVGNVAAVVAPLTLPASPVALGANVALSTTLTDAGTNDTHVASVAWGDLATTAAAVTGSGPKSVSASHAYSSAGTFPVTLTVTDDDGGVTTRTGSVTIDGPPTVSAGGPYAGNEGSSIPMHGTASDPEHDSLTVSWNIAPTVSDPGTTCTNSNTNTLDPSVQCNDDAQLSASVTVNDGINAPVTSTPATITVNNVAPTISAVSAAPGVIPTGGSTTVSAGFADVGTHDTHTATIDWGDNTPTQAGSISETNGSGTASGTHTYAAPAVYTVTVTVIDDNGGTVSRSTSVTVSAPPSADAGGPYVGFEGSPATLNATASDPEGDPLAVSWSYASPPPGVTCSGVNLTTLTPSFTCNDNVTLALTLTVSDGINAPVTRTATLILGNVAPAADAPVITPNTPVSVGTPISVDLPFADDGTADTHTASIDWGDGNSEAGTVNEANGSGDVTGTHAYSSPGSYVISVTVTDDDGGWTTQSGFTGEMTNDAPTIAAGGPYTAAEGSVVTLAATATDTESDPLVVSWSFVVAGANGVSCTYTGVDTLTPTVHCNDNALVTAILSVSDPYHTVQDFSTVSVSNVAPAVSAITAPATIARGSSFSISVPFSDAGTNDTHTATINWGDGNQTAGVVSESHGAGTVSGTKIYAPAVTPGVKTITVTVKDDDLGATVVTKTITVT